MPRERTQRHLQRWSGVLVEAKLMPCNPFAQHAAPGMLPLPQAGEMTFSFALNYPKCFPKAPGNASKRFYSLRV